MFSNKKLWIHTLKALLKEKKGTGGVEKEEEWKGSCRTRQNNAGGVWRGLKTILGSNYQAAGDNDLNSSLIKHLLCPPICPHCRNPPRPHRTAPPPLSPWLFTPTPTASEPTKHTTPCSSLCRTTLQVLVQLRKPTPGRLPVLMTSDPGFLRRPTLWNSWSEVEPGPQLWKTSCMVPGPRTHFPLRYFLLLSATRRRRFKLIKKVRSVLLDPVELMGERRMMTKLPAVVRVQTNKKRRQSLKGVLFWKNYQILCRLPRASS